MEFGIFEMQQAEWPQIAAIYEDGLRTGIATFQSSIPEWEEWNQSHCRTCRLVARSDERVLGWAALSQVSERCVYSGVGEVSIYVAENCRGCGIGKKLLIQLVDSSEDNGFWSLQAGIIKENLPSRELHKKCGFREVGIRERPGMMSDGRWYDVVIMERRSSRVGI